MTQIKICGLTNLTDAEHAWRCGADLLGFVFVASSPRHMTAAQVAPIASALRDQGCQAKLVGVFAGIEVTSVRKAVLDCGLDLAQWHVEGPTPTAQALGAPILKVVRVRGEIDWQALASLDAHAVVLDTYHPKALGGTGACWDWSLLQDARRPPSLRILLAGGLSPENVAQAVRQAQPWGVDVSSGVESRPGKKESARLQRFIDTVREEDRRS